MFDKCSACYITFFFRIWYYLNQEKGHCPLLLPNLNETLTKALLSNYLIALGVGLLTFKAILSILGKCYRLSLKLLLSCRVSSCKAHMC